MKHAVFIGCALAIAVTSFGDFRVSAVYLFEGTATVKAGGGYWQPSATTIRATPGVTLLDQPISLGGDLIVGVERPVATRRPSVMHAPTKVPHPQRLSSRRARHPRTARRLARTTSRPTARKPCMEFRQASCASGSRSVGRSPNR